MFRFYIKINACSPSCFIKTNRSCSAINDIIS
nr:MAG TPA: hypothetical protein [Caudoviricetes sp.]